MTSDPGTTSSHHYNLGSSAVAEGAVALPKKKMENQRRCSPWYHSQIWTSKLKNQHLTASGARCITISSFNGGKADLPQVSFQHCKLGKNHSALDPRIPSFRIEDLMSSFITLQLLILEKNSCWTIRCDGGRVGRGLQGALQLLYFRLF